MPLIIHKVEERKDTPNEARQYSLDEHDTVEKAAASYKAHYGVEPVEGWQWKSILYFLEPEVKK